MCKETIQQAVPLWLYYVNAREALLKANVTRSYKDPERDFAEWLVTKFLGGKLVDKKNQENYDVISKNGEKIQVKSIGKSPDNKNGYIITAKDKNNTEASHYAFVIFKDFIPEVIFIVKKEFIQTFKNKQIKRSDLEVNSEEVFLIKKLFQDIKNDGIKPFEWVGDVTEFSKKLREKAWTR